MGTIYEQKSLVKLSRTLPTINKASKQTKGMDSVSPLSFMSIQKKPIPIREDQTEIGSLYKDDTPSESEPLTFVKIDENTFLLEDDMVIIWNGTKYIKRDGSDFNLASYSKPQEKTLAIGMSEYGSLLNTGSHYTYMQTTNANPCIILILRSKNETEMYHITINNDNWRNNIWGFIKRQIEEPVDDIDGVKDRHITENGIRAYLYQGESEYQDVLNEYNSSSYDSKMQYLARLKPYVQEHVRQHEKLKEIEEYLILGGILPYKEIQENVRIKLEDGTIDFPTDQDINSDLGKMVYLRGKNKGNASPDLIPRKSNVETGDNYQEILQSMT